MLSPSTEGYDRGKKFDHYQTIDSLQDYLLVEQDQARVLLFSRRGSRLEMQEAKGMEGNVHLPSVNVMLALADVYALIEFGAE